MSIREVRVDDLDHTTTEGVEAYTFSWLGVDYSVDLGEKSAKKLIDVMSTYAEVATQLGRRSSGPRAQRSAPSSDSTSTSSRKPSGSGYSKEELQAVRAWGKQAGIDINPRGRIKQSVLEQYEADHQA